MTTAVVFNFVRVSENICTICLEIFHTAYGKCVATVPLFAETFNREVSNVLCENHSNQVKMAKGLFAKNALGK